MASHFARLRLLDPDRFYDLDEFIKEAESYRDVAASSAAESSRAIAVHDDRRRPGADSWRNRRTRGARRQVAQGDAGVRDGVDGRAARSARHRARDVPQHARDDHRISQAGRPHSSAWRERHRAIQGARGRIGRRHGFECGRHVPSTFTHDPRIDWLAELLQSLGSARRCCSSAAPDARSRPSMRPCSIARTIKMAVVSRRAVAGATRPQRRVVRRGGRRAHADLLGDRQRRAELPVRPSLVLFDLPLDPGLLEQRIGRLDRIGQREEIQVHVPVIGQRSGGLGALVSRGTRTRSRSTCLAHSELLELFGERFARPRLPRSSRSAVPFRRNWIDSSRDRARGPSRSGRATRAGARSAAGMELVPSGTVVARHRGHRAAR